MFKRLPELLEVCLQFVIVFFTWPLMWIYIHKLYHDIPQGGNFSISIFKDLYKKIDTPEKLKREYYITVIEFGVAYIVIKYVNIYLGVNLLLVIISSCVLVLSVQGYVKRNKIRF